MPKRVGTPPSAPSGGSEGSRGTPPDAPGSGRSSAVTSWDATTEFASDTEESDGTYASTGTDENAVHVSDGSVVLHNPTVTRSSGESSGGDNSSCYGVGAAILTTGGTSYIDGGTVTSDADGGAGIFSYGDGVTNVADTAITTTGSTAGAIYVAGAVRCTPTM